MKKKLISMTAFLLCLALCLTGCGKGNGAETETRPGGSVPETRPGSGEGADLPSAADYYRYLKDEVLEEFSGEGHLTGGHLAEVEPHEMQLNKGNFNEVMRRNNRLLGVISAVVEDFDGDGILEMLVIRATQTKERYSMFSAVTGTEDSDRCVITMYASFYDCEGGKIRLDDARSPRGIAELSLSGWGYMAVGLERLDNGYYLYTSTYSENLSTYGPRYSTVASVTGQRPGYVSGVAALGLSEAEANQLFGRDEVYDYSDTTIHDRLAAMGKAEGATNNLDREEEVFADALGGGLLCFFNVAHPEWGGNTIVHTTTDYTDLRHYLNNDAADWTPHPIPQGGSREVPKGPDAILEFAGDLEAATGVELRSKEPSEANGVWSQRFDGQDCDLTVSWDVSKNRLVEVSLYSSQEIPTEEWYLLKDAILDHPNFGWSNGEADFLKGRVSWNDYFNGVTVGDYSCAVGAVMNAFFRVSLIDAAF